LSTLLPSLYSHESSFVRVHVFFFHDPPPPAISTLSLHDALPIFRERKGLWREGARRPGECRDEEGRHRRRRARSHHGRQRQSRQDRKSTRLNSSHLGISYAVFCLKKKKAKFILFFYSFI